MNQLEALETLAEVNAVIKGSHIVYTSDKHGSAYVNKDALYPHTEKTSQLCRAIAEQFADDNVEVVIAPAIGGVILSQWIAHHLSEITGREVLAIYAEKAERSLFKAVVETVLNIITLGLYKLSKGEELVIKEGRFVVKRGYDKLIPGKNVLVVEDVLTTGGSARKVVEVTRSLDGNVIGLGVLCNRGGITPKDVANPPKLFALVNVKLDAWDEADCPLCATNMPINTDVGKGREYLAREKTN